MGIQVTLPTPAQIASGTGAGSIPVQETPATPQSGTAAVNTAVAITIAGVALQTIRITHLSWSYSAAPTAGSLTVVVNGVTIWQSDITSAGSGAVPLPPGGIICQAGQNAVVTLSAAGAAVAGRLNVASITGP